MDKLKHKLPLHVYNTLINAQIDSLKLIVGANITELQQITKLSYEEIKKVQEEAIFIITENKLTTGLCLDEPARLSTGCSNIDRLLKNGIPTCCITEIVGKSGCGKTQLCMQLLITVQYPVSKGGFSAGAVYISTEATFPSSRFHQLCKNVPQRLGQIDNIKLEDNIFVDHIADYEQIRRCLYVRLPKLLSQKNVRLIIIDSIAGVWRHENKDINYYARSLEILHIFKQLIDVAYSYNLAIVCVNQVMDNINSGESEPCLGLTWSNLINNRLLMTRSDTGIRKLEVKFAPDLPSDYCIFNLTNEGISDLK